MNNDCDCLKTKDVSNFLWGFLIWVVIGVCLIHQPLITLAFGAGYVGLRILFGSLRSLFKVASVRHACRMVVGLIPILILILLAGH
jgi:hypothetical protein